MFSPTRREFVEYAGAATAGAGLGLPSLDVDLAALAPEEIDRSTPYVYLRLDGVPGDADATGHEGDIACFACRWGVEGDATRMPRRGRDPHRGHVTVLKAIDKATPLLYEAAASGGRLKTADVTLERPRADGRTAPYCVLELDDVGLVGFDAGQRGADPLERCVLDYDRMRVRYLG